MKTIRQALIDEIIYPIPEGLIENKLISRQLNSSDEYTYETTKDHRYMGACADCLVALTQSINFSESDKSVGTLSDEVKQKLITRANLIYRAIGEEEMPDPKPMVYINC